jgi:PAS domain S-box-containing protein
MDQNNNLNSTVPTPDFQVLFNDSFVAQALASREGQLQEVNDQFCRLLRRSREELLQMNCKNITHPEDPTIAMDIIGEFERDNLQNWQTEKRYLRGDGTVLWALLNLTVFRGPDGKVTQVFVQIQDISLQKQLEADLRHHNKDLDQFVYIASHDLREPLTAISGFATLVKRRFWGHLDRDGRHYIDQIIDGARRMEGKIDDLLAFSRAGRPSNGGEFPLGAAIDEAKRAVVRQISESRAIIEVQGDLPVIRGDRSMIAQVFQNLFSNAIKYSKTGQPPKIRICVQRYSADDGYWLVSVSDEGIGFNMEHRERIFVLFQRLYTVEQYPGTGVGLAIAKRIIERHRGRIWPDSKPDKGTTFYFTLPTE